MAQRKLTSEFRRLRSDYKSRSGGTKRRSSSFNSSAGNQLLTGDVSSSAWEQVWYFFYLYQTYIKYTFYPILILFVVASFVLLFCLPSFSLSISAKHFFLFPCVSIKKRHNTHYHRIG